MFYTTTNTKAVRRDTFAVGSPLNALVCFKNFLWFWNNRDIDRQKFGDGDRI